MDEEEITTQDLQFGNYSLKGNGDENMQTISLAANSSGGGSSKHEMPAKMNLHATDSESEEEVFSDHGEDNRLLSNSGSKSKPAIWTFEYYQKFFNVDTSQVINRIQASIIPSLSRNMIKSHIRPNPDLYGPFWIAATLVFAIAVNGNISSYLRQKSGSWNYDLDKITTAGAVLSVYLCLIPLLLWLFLRWRRSMDMFSLLEIVCVYGYSLAIFVPASVLWLIPFTWLQITISVLCLIVSATSLCLTFWPAVEEEDRLISFGVLAILVLLHSGLVASFMVSIPLEVFKVQAVNMTMPDNSTVLPLNLTLNEDLNQDQEDQKMTPAVEKDSSNDLKREQKRESKDSRSSESVIREVHQILADRIKGRSS